MATSEKELLDNLILRQKRDEIHILCDLLFNEMRKTTPKDSVQKISHLVETFVLVRALEEVFFPHLKMVCGYVLFAVPTKRPSEITSLRSVPHSWLQHDNYRLVDVVPVDGSLGVSVPQAVFQDPQSVRFIPTAAIYPSSWKKSHIEDVNAKVRSLANILFALQEKVP